MRRPPVERPVISFVAEAFKRPPEVPAIACAAIVETAAEKFVGLTRRAGAALAGVQRYRDPTLVRHVYDLHVIREHYDAADVAALSGARSCKLTQRPRVINFPPIATIRLRRDVARRRRYRRRRLCPQLRRFSAGHGLLVYGEAPDFETAIATLKAMAAVLKVSLLGTGGSMTFKQSTLEEIIESESLMVSTAEERYGQHYRHARGCSVQHKEPRSQHAASFENIFLLWRQKLI